MMGIQRIVKLWTLEINWKQSGVCSTQRQAKRMGITSIIIMDLTVHKEKFIELRRECRVLKRRHKKTFLKQMNDLKIAPALRRVQFENFQNHQYLLFTNCTRWCDFLFIVHSTKLPPSRGNLIGTPMEYNLGLIVLLLTNHNWVTWDLCVRHQLLTLHPLSVLHA